MLTRRQFLATSGAFLILRNHLSIADTILGATNLTPDPKSIIDVAPGLRYRVITKMGERMSDRHLVPGRQDGMAAFPGRNNQVVLLCNHELNAQSRELSAFSATKIDWDALEKYFYDSGYQRTPSWGGVSRIVYDLKAEQVVHQEMALMGTNSNCAGGTTPWQTWISCEENTDRARKKSGAKASEKEIWHEKNHGYCFEIPAHTKGALINPEPLKHLGRFNHEAVAVDPRTSIVYLTEDRPDSVFYRFVPEQPGNLQRSGKLQALAIIDSPQRDTRNWTTATFKEYGLAAAEPQERFTEQQEFAVHWIDLHDIESPKDSLRHQAVESGAAVFARGEGIWWGNNECYFACTTGGSAALGQLFRYQPSSKEGRADEKDASGKLTLWIESTRPSAFNKVDNLTIAPWGDVILCEDHANGSCALRGIRSDLSIYTIALNRYSDSELAGCCFSPDGSTLFVNLQENHMTLAITGDWKKARSEL